MNAVIVKLDAKDREQGKNPRQLRALGQFPVTIYGKDINLNLAIDTRKFKLSYQKDKNTQFEFTYNGKNYLTVTKNVQQNYATGEILSAEFAIA